MNSAGTTFILTTHDLEDVKQLASHVMIINHGKKVFDDTLQKLQMNLGEKKIVELTLEQSLDADNSGFYAGARIIEQKSPFEVTLEVDASKTPIADFIENLSRKINFSDISVKELSMEEIITQIYREKEGT
jgi:ABC-2 type transport system ATP-binding protein